MKFIAVHEEESIESGIKMKQYHYRSEPQTGQDGMPDYSTMRYLYLRVLADTGQVVNFNLQDEAGRGDNDSIQGRRTGNSHSIYAKVPGTGGGRRGNLILKLTTQRNSLLPHGSPPTGFSGLIHVIKGHRRY